MYRLFAAFAVGCALAGTARGADTPDFKTTAHSIAIMSLVGDRIATTGHGFVDVPPPGLDVLNERSLADQIKIDLPNASVVAVGGERGAWRDVLRKAHGFGDMGMKQLRDELGPWAAVHAVDYIVVLRNGEGYPFPQSFYKFYFWGIGLAPYDTYANPNGVAPAALLNITVLDGKTLDVVADLSARDVNWGSIAYPRSALSDEQKQILIDDTRAMLASIVPGLAHGVGL